MQARPPPHRSPLVETIGLVVRLSPFDGLFRGRCVLHDDPGRMLYIDAQGSFFHCFACGAHGDERCWNELTAGRAG